MSRILPSSVPSPASISNANGDYRSLVAQSAAAPLELGRSTQRAMRDIEANIEKALRDPAYDGKMIAGTIGRNTLLPKQQECNAPTYATWKYDRDTKTITVTIDTLGTGNHLDRLSWPYRDPKNVSVESGYEGQFSKSTDPATASVVDRAIKDYGRVHLGAPDTYYFEGWSR